MSRPRTPFGPERPGRMAATALRVLAAETSDPGRFARGKRYWSDRSVTDIVVGHGAVTAEVLGSRRTPYVVTIEARPGRGVPARSEVTIRCSCPDDDGWGRSACKHAVAALLTLGDELSIEPDLLARWRRTDTVSDDGDDDGGDDVGDELGDDVGDELGDDAADADDPDHGDAGVEHPLAAMMRAPDGASLPPVPELTPADHPPFPDPLVAPVLDDARGELRFRWE